MPYYTLSPTYSVCKNHGYISGEKYVCDKCGEHTEVYSRITGYYRPVSNWNAGKTQEFKDRRLYNSEVALTKEPKEGAKAQTVQTATAVKDKDDESSKKFLLFTTKTCPNCKAAKKYLDEAQIPYQTVQVEDHMDLAVEYGVQSAPTLVVQSEDKRDLYVNSSVIRAFTEENM